MTSVEAVPIQVRREDARLDARVTRTGRESLVARAELHQFRWEMTVCEHGPQFSHEAYAGAINKARSTVTGSVLAWEKAAQKSNDSVGGPTNALRCRYAGMAHPGIVVSADASAGVKPTETEAEDTQREVHVLRVGEVKTLAIELLAAHFGLTETTVQVRRPELVKEVVRRARDEADLSSMDEQDVRQLLNRHALVLRDEDKLRARRERRVQQWMAANRGVGVDGVSVAEVRSMTATIDGLAERKGIPWEDAETERKVWDERIREAERIENEAKRKARLAVLDLLAASADMAKAAIRMVQAQRVVKADRIPVSADEQALVVSDLDAAEAAIRLARLAVTGDADIDWDAELERLLGGAAR
jgi:hypothetical protein